MNPRINVRWFKGKGVHPRKCRKHDLETAIVLKGPLIGPTFKLGFRLPTHGGHCGHHANFPTKDGPRYRKRKISIRTRISKTNRWKVVILAPIKNPSPVSSKIAKLCSKTIMPKHGHARHFLTITWLNMNIFEWNQHLFTCPLWFISNICKNAWFVSMKTSKKWSKLAIYGFGLLRKTPPLKILYYSNVFSIFFLQIFRIN